MIEQTRSDQADLVSQALVLHSFNLFQHVASQPELGMLVKKECQAKQLEPLGKLKAILMRADCHVYEDEDIAGAQYKRANLGVSTDGHSRVITIKYSSTIAEAVQIVPDWLSRIT